MATSKRIYSKEEVICNRPQNVSKTGCSGRPLSMQPHHQQSTGEDGRVKERRKKEYLLWSEIAQHDIIISLECCPHKAIIRPTSVGYISFGKTPAGPLVLNSLLKEQCL